MIADLPPELLILPPLAIAAGIDLYLTLLLIGAAPTTGLWTTPLPGALGDLDPPGVLIMVGIFYVLEFLAERFPATALSWNAFHAIIRPVSGALLGLLILDGQPLWLMASGALVGGALASLAHAVRSGAAVLRWLGTGAAPSVLLVSLAEDVAVVGIVSLALDLPRWAALLAAALLVGLAPFAPSLVRAFTYTVRLAIALLFQHVRWRGWHGHDHLPAWVGGAFRDRDDLVPGGTLRGTPVGAWRLPGAPRFAVGWVVVRGNIAVFVHRRGARTLRVDLHAWPSSGLEEHPLFRRLDLLVHGRGAFVLFGPRGPGMESLRAEFGVPTS